MNKAVLVIIFLLVTCSIYAQNISANVTDQFDLPNTVWETSGLIIYNNKLITHNDSGNSAELYEINRTNGSIDRVITITNATNVDWEDIAQDNNYIYIGDIGNNNGNRVDLKIYRILKSDFDTSTNVMADVINYSYADQTNFTALNNNNNWDAEAFIIYGDHILIFSKNWVNEETNVYAFSKNIGTHSAVNVSNYNVQGLITGADINNNTIFLSGYSSDSVTPIAIEINNTPLSSQSNLDIFSSADVTRYSGFLPFGNQVEGICYISSLGLEDTLYISNERLTITNPFPITFNSKLRTLTLNNSTLSITNLETKPKLKLYPNPFKNSIKLNKTVASISIVNSLGQIILSKRNTNLIDTVDFPKGFYYVSINDGENKINRIMIK